MAQLVTSMSDVMLSHNIGVVSLNSTWGEIFTEYNSTVDKHIQSDIEDILSP